MAVESYVMGLITANINGAMEKVGELEKVTLDITADLHTRTVSYSRDPAEIIPTILKYALSATRAYFEAGLTRAMLDGKPLEVVMYGKKGTADPEPLRHLTGFQLNKITLGDFDGKKHVTEDFSGEGIGVDLLDE